MKPRRLTAATATLLVAWATASEAAAQDPSDAIYNENTFGEFRLTILPTDWNKIVNDPWGAGDLWQRCSITWQGETVDDVAVKAVNTNRYAGSQKPAFRIKFDEFVPGREWRGVDTIKFEGSIREGLVERLTYRMYRQFGVPAPRSCHANLYVNDALRGVYTVIEPVRKKFIKYHLQIANPDGNLFKAIRGASDYQWLGWDPASYVPGSYEAVTNEVGGDYRDLVGLIDIFNNAPPAQRRTRLDGYIHLDTFLSYLAVLHAVADFDGITGANNHYWYHREDSGRMQLIPWDASNGFDRHNTGISPTTDPWAWLDNNASTAWIMNDAVARSTYDTELRQALDGPLAGASARTDFINNQIRNAVVADPYKNQMNSPHSITTSQYDAFIQDQKAWIAQRITYLNSRLPAATLPTVTIAPTDASGSEPSGTAVFTVSRTGSTAGALPVNYTISGTATNGADFNTIGTTVAIGAGSSSATVTIQVRDDTAVEGNETVILTLAADAGYSVGNPSAATVTILDNDSTPALPTVTIAATDPGAAEPSNTGTFTVTRTSSTGTALAVAYAVAGTATSGTDFTALSGTVTIPAGASSATVTVTPQDDTSVESSETVVLTLSAGTGYTVGTPSTDTVSIADNDSGVPAPQITAPAAGTTFSPGQSVTATGTGTNLSWRINRVGDGLPAFATGTGTSLMFTVPGDSTTAQSIQITLTGNGGTDEQTHAIGGPSPLTVTLQDGVAGYVGTRDTYLSQNSPTTNFGGDLSVRVDGDEIGGSDLVALLKFDLTSIPAGSSIQTVDLTLAVTNPSAGTYEVYEARRAWVEGEATWDVYRSGQGWEAAGAGGGQDRGTMVLGTIGAGTATLTLSAALVQGWVDAPGTNYGLIIAGTANADGMAFDSREGANRPKLVIAYMPGAPPVDTDGDGMTDVGELGAGFDPGNSDQDQSGTLDGLDDWDGDGINNQTELTAGTPAGSPPGGTGGAGGDGGGGCGATGAEAILLMALLRRLARRA